MAPTQDIPAEFLPSLPQHRQQRGGSVVSDARTEAMRAHMQQRPASIRHDGSGPINQHRGSQRMSTSNASPVRTSMSHQQQHQQQQQLYDYQERQRAGSASSVVRDTRSNSVNNNNNYSRSGSVINNTQQQRDSMRSTAAAQRAPLPPSTITLNPNHQRKTSVSRHTSNPSLPIAMARPESTVNPQYLANLPAGSRTTLTLDDSELGRRIHAQLASSPAASSSSRKVNDGEEELVTAEIVQQEVTDRRQALLELDEEIAALEAEILQAGRRLDADSDFHERQWMEHMQQGEERVDYMRPQSHKPKFSLCIFILTLAFMCAEIAFNGGLADISVNPMLGPSPDVLLAMGAKRADLIVEEGQWWRLFLPIVLHGGILHFIVNMLALWNLGVSLEREYGTWKIATIYLASGFFGVLVSCLFAPQQVSVGASGAIFGLFGACWAELIQNWSLYRGTQMCNMFQLFVLTVINFVVGLMPFLDNFAHLGGMVCGLVLGLLLLVQTRYVYTGQRKSKRRYQVALMACSFLVFPALMAAGYAVLYTSGPVDCDWCQALSCVPMPPGASYHERWWNCDACSQGNLEGEISNGLLQFVCPNSGEPQSKQFPTSGSVTQTQLLDACVELCL